MLVQDRQLSRLYGTRTLDALICVERIRSTSYVNYDHSHLINSKEKKINIEIPSAKRFGISRECSINFDQFSALKILGKLLLNNSTLNYIIISSNYKTNLFSE